MNPDPWLSIVQMIALGLLLIAKADTVNYRQILPTGYQSFQQRADSHIVLVDHITT